MTKFKTFISNHSESLFGLCLVLAFAVVVGSACGYISHIKTKARNQAISRAQNMDGRTFTITQVGWNWVGDTKLWLTDENGKDAGWISMYMANPFNEKINPFFLAFTDPHGRVPIPMKVKARFRPTPWTDKNDGETKENFTGSYLEFEVL